MDRIVVDLFDWRGTKIARQTIHATPQGRFSTPVWDPNIVRSWKIVEIVMEP